MQKRENGKMRIALFHDRNKDAFNQFYDNYADEFKKIGASEHPIREIFRDYSQDMAEKYIARAAEYHDVIVWNERPTDKHVEPKLFGELRKKCKIVTLLGDASYYWECRDKAFAENSDLTVIYDNLLIAQTADEKVKTLYMPPAHNPNIFRKKNTQKDIDVLFIGGLCDRPTRKRMLRALEKAGIKTTIYGAGSKNRQISTNEMVDLTNRAKICLNFSDTDTKTKIPAPIRSPWQLKGRVTEVAMCGSFLLTQYFWGSEKIFGGPACTFDSEESLVGSVKYYLEHESDREEQAAAHHEYAKKEYTSEKITKKILEAI